MYFDSVAAALAMDGHGAYVWFVYAVVTLVIAWMLLAPVLRGRRILAQARAQLRRESRLNQREGVDASGS